MIYTKEEIKKLIKNKIVKITGLDEKSIGPASIDLNLDKKIRVFTTGSKTISDDLEYKKYTKIIDISKGYILSPGELVLGITKEKVTLPKNICGFLNSRSSYARIGLMSHITAPFIAPGISNKQVLEIYNAGNHKIKLMPNRKICHLVLCKCIGEAEYKGKWKNQKI
jgi:dCTP deaminase